MIQQYVLDVSRDVAADAVDGLADEVVGGDEDAADEEDGGGGAVVQLEDEVVNVGLGAVTDLDQPHHRHQHVHHSHDELLLCFFFFEHSKFNEKKCKSGVNLRLSRQQPIPVKF